MSESDHTYRKYFFRISISYIIGTIAIGMATLAGVVAFARPLLFAVFVFGIWSGYLTGKYRHRIAAWGELFRLRLFSPSHHAGAKSMFS